MRTIMLETTVYLVLNKIFQQKCHDTFRVTIYNLLALDLFLQIYADQQIISSF